MAPGALPRPPRAPQGGPKGRPGGPRRLLRGPQEAPKRPPRGPKRWRLVTGGVWLRGLVGHLRAFRTASCS
eukprot:8339801-Pyramimonas_sp.AAC.1